MVEKTSKRFILALVVGVLGGILYIFSNTLGELRGAIDIQFGFEDYIPFVPQAVFVYLMIFPFLGSAIFTVPKYKDFFRVICGYGAIIIISNIIFIIIPTTMARPEIIEKGIIAFLFHIIHYVDGPNNLFPSLHVSSVVYIALVNNLYYPKSGAISILIAILIAVSTLLVKQHAILDVLGGVCLGYLVFSVIFCNFKEKNIKEPQ